MTTISEKIFSIRTQFSGSALDDQKISKDPLKQFELWMEDALKSKIPEPNAFNLATADNEGIPSLRVVLLRGFDKNGFTFYTNYKSHKGTDLAKNPNACMNFFWPELSRQIRISGKVKKLPARVSDRYFNSRPRESQIGAWASAQSTILAGRAELELSVKDFEKKFSGKSVPRPPHWGGFCVVPDKIEFWQGKMSRLHDRIEYRKSKRSWILSRLAP